MNNSKELPFKISAFQICVIALGCVILDVITERFGTYPHYSSGGFSHMEMVGVLFPSIALIVPIFEKKYRKNFWSKTNLIMLFTVLTVCLVLITITYANKDYYRFLWIESNHWERDNCPPIRWDVWNIINKRA